MDRTHERNRIGSEIARQTPVTFGRLLTERQLVSAVVTEALYPAGTEIPDHAHDFPSLMWAVSGSLTERVENVTFACDPSCVVYKPAGTVHSTRATDGPSRVFVVELLPALVDSMAEVVRLRQENAFASGGVPAAIALRVARAMSDETELSEPEFEELLLELAEGVALRRPVRKGVPGWLRGVREHLDEEPGRTHTLSGLAAEAGVHPVYLARAFRAGFGCSVSEYLHVRRLDLAVEALVATDAEVGSIGLRLGYYDHAHFTRFFSRRVGMSPSAFRRAARAEP